MKTSGFFLASMAAVLILPGCNFHRFDDDITGPDGSPVCSIGQFYIESAILTTRHGGYVSVRLEVNNTDGSSPAFNVHADITAWGGGLMLGGTSIDFNTLHEGEFAGSFLDVQVSGTPDEMDCNLSWEDGAGNYYSTGATAAVFGYLLKSTPDRD